MHQSMVPIFEYFLLEYFFNADLGGSLQATLISQVQFFLCSYYGRDTVTFTVTTEAAGLEGNPLPSRTYQTFTQVTRSWHPKRMNQSRIQDTVSFTVLMLKVGFSRRLARFIEWSKGGFEYHDIGVMCRWQQRSSRQGHFPHLRHESQNVKNLCCSIFSHFNLSISI